MLFALCGLLWHWLNRPWLRTQLAAWGSAPVWPIAGLWLTQRLLA